MDVAREWTVNRLPHKDVTTKAAVRFAGYKIQKQNEIKDVRLKNMMYSLSPYHWLPAAAAVPTSGIYQNMMSGPKGPQISFTERSAA